MRLLVGWETQGIGALAAAARGLLLLLAKHKGRAFSFARSGAAAPASHPSLSSRTCGSSSASLSPHWLPLKTRPASALTLAPPHRSLGNRDKEEEAAAAALLHLQAKRAARPRFPASCGRQTDR